MKMVTPGLISDKASAKIRETIIRLGEWMLFWSDVSELCWELTCNWFSLKLEQNKLQNCVSTLFVDWFMLNLRKSLMCLSWPFRHCYMIIHYLSLGIFTSFAVIFVMVTFFVHAYIFTNEPLWKKSFEDYIMWVSNISVCICEHL